MSHVLDRGDEEQVLALAQRYGYELEKRGPIGLLIFVKDTVQINVWTTTMTVATCLSHPTKGRTQLFRRRVPYDLLGRLFENPRAHTGRGYYERPERRTP